MAQAYLFILLFFFLFSFFLWSKLGLFLLFPFAFIFASLVTHICFSVIEKKISFQLRQISLTGLPSFLSGISILTSRTPTVYPSGQRTRTRHPETA